MVRIMEWDMAHNERKIQNLRKIMTCNSLRAKHIVVLLRTMKPIYYKNNLTQRLGL